MTVFTNRAVGRYCGGLAVVAANSVEEAHETLLSRYDNEPYKQWVRSYYDDIYKSDNWQLVEGVIANTDLPYVIAEENYYDC